MDSLSAEVVQTIFAFTDHIGFVRLSMACRRLHQLASQSSARRAFLVSRYPELPFVINYQQPEPSVGDGLHRLAFAPYRDSNVEGNRTGGETTDGISMDSNGGNDGIPFRLGEEFNLDSVDKALRHLLTDSVMVQFIVGYIKKGTLSFSHSHVAHTHLMHFCASMGFAESLSLLLNVFVHTFFPAERLLALLAAAAHGRSVCAHVLWPYVDASMLVNYHDGQLFKLILTKLPDCDCLPMLSRVFKAISSAPFYAMAKDAYPTANKNSLQMVSSNNRSLSFNRNDSNAINSDDDDDVFYGDDEESSEEEDILQPKSIAVMTDSLRCLLRKCIHWSLSELNAMPRLLFLLRVANLHPEKLEIDWNALSQHHFSLLLRAFWQSAILNHQDSYCYFDLLEIAVSKNYSYVVSLMIGYGLRADFHNGWPVQLACMHDSPEIVSLLLKHPGKLKHLKFTLLEDAIANGRLSLFKALFEYDKSASKLDGSLKIAVISSRTEIVVHLLDTVKSLLLSPSSANKRWLTMDAAVKILSKSHESALHRNNTQIATIINKTLESFNSIETT